MIIAIDTETRGLDATKFILGCILKENTEKPEYYWNKKEMWQRILQLARSEQKRKKTLTIYAFKHEYDFYAYADLRDKNIIINRSNPLIAKYEENGKKLIDFLDCKALYPFKNLKEVGDIIGIPKLDMPEQLKKGEEIHPMMKNTLKQYIKRDTEIALKSVLYIKNKLKQEGIKTKKLYSSAQIGISYILKKLQNDNDTNIFFNRKLQMIKRPMYLKEVHQSYRGCRVEAFKTGFIPKCTYEDCNSLYPYSLATMRFPDLDTERKIERPLTFLTEHELLKKIGITKALVYNKNNDLGILMLRTNKHNYHPKSNKYLIGIWTNEELRIAKLQGYKIIDIEWSIVWDETYNPFTNIIQDLYEKRKLEDKFSKTFYKNVMNMGIGKLAQNKKDKEIRIDYVEKQEEYEERGFDYLRGIGLMYIYEKEESYQPYKRYYCPIIPSLTTAQARIHMYRNMSLYNFKDLIYTDTDSITHLGNQKTETGQNIGQFKLEYNNEEALIYGRKTYYIGDQIKVSGIRKRGITKQSFKDGIIISPKMKTIKTSKDFKDIGTFTQEERNLKNQLKEHEKREQELASKTLYKDSNIDDIRYFLPHLKMIANWKKLEIMN